MSYKYSDFKDKIFTDEGQIKFLASRDKINTALDTHGVFRLGEMLDIVKGDAWEFLSHIDRLVEIGEIKEVFHGDGITQRKIYTRRRG